MQKDEKNHHRRRRAAAAAILVGIDAGKEKAGVVRRVRGEPDSKGDEFEIDLKGFKKLLAYIHAGTGATVTAAEVIVGIELAGVYGLTLAEYLTEAGYQVVGVQPRHTKALKEVVHGQALKTDLKDAATIVDLVGQGRFFDSAFGRGVYTPLRQLSSAREALDTQRTRTINRLKSVLQLVFPEYEKVWGKGKIANPTALAVLKEFPGPADYLDPTREGELRALLNWVSRGHAKGKYEKLVSYATHTLALRSAQDVLRWEIPLLVAQLQLFVAQLAAVDAKIAAQLGAVDSAGEPVFPEVVFLKTIPNIGTNTVASFLGTVGDLRRYHSVREVLALTGLSLVEKSSGMKRGRPRLSKRGDTTFRRLLYWVVTRNITEGKQKRTRGIYRDQYEHELGKTKGPKTEKGLPKKAMVNVMRRVLAQMYAVGRARRAWTAVPPVAPVPTRAIPGRKRAARKDLGSAA